MTREEAIRHIRDVIAENNSIKPNIVTFEQEKEALYMAIEALSADTVSREHHDMEVKELKHQIKDQADMVSVVRCKDCKHLDVWNLKNIYAVCSKHGITFEPFEDDTRTHFCAWRERRGEK